MDPTEYTVHVRDYHRVREGMEEQVRKHRRRRRRWFRRPRT